MFCPFAPPILVKILYLTSGKFGPILAFSLPEIEKSPWIDFCLILFDSGWFCLILWSFLLLFVILFLEAWSNLVGEAEAGESKTSGLLPSVVSSVRLKTNQGNIFSEGAGTFLKTALNTPPPFVCALLFCWGGSEYCYQLSILKALDPPTQK